MAGKPHYSRDEVQRRLAAGEAPRQIAHSMGCALKTVRRLILELAARPTAHHVQSGAGLVASSTKPIMSTPELPRRRFRLPVRHAPSAPTTTSPIMSKPAVPAHVELLAQIEAQAQEHGVVWDDPPPDPPFSDPTVGGVVVHRPGSSSIHYSPAYDASRAPRPDPRAFPREPLDSELESDADDDRPY